MAEKLTGRGRHRLYKPWFGKAKMVLQIEVTYPHMQDLNGSGHYDRYIITEWRDARPEDLLPVYGDENVKSS